MIIQIFWVVFLMFIWFKTDAFTDYFSYLKSVKDWKSYKSEKNPELSYPDYIFLNNQNFRTKLLSCRHCLLFWFVILTSFYFGFFNFPIVYILSLILFRLIEKNI
jgi:hypothetical protein